MNKYVFYSDEGHGWLRVPMKEITKLDIEKDISSCSFKDNVYAYLEEDVDAYIFVKAKGYGDKFSKFVREFIEFEEVVDFKNSILPIAYGRFSN